MTSQRLRPPRHLRGSEEIASIEESSGGSANTTARPRRRLAGRGQRPCRHGRRWVVRRRAQRELSARRRHDRSRRRCGVVADPRPGGIGAAGRIGSSAVRPSASTTRRWATPCCASRIPPTVRWRRSPLGCWCCCPGERSAWRGPSGVRRVPSAPPWEPSWCWRPPRGRCTGSSLGSTALGPSSARGRRCWPLFWACSAPLGQRAAMLRWLAESWPAWRSSSTPPLCRAWRWSASHC